MTDHPSPDDRFDPTDPAMVAWAGQDETGGGSLLSADLATLADTIDQAHRNDQRRLLWLNVQEVLPSLVGAYIFGSAIPRAERPVAVGLAAAVALAVGGFLAVSSIRHHRADRRWDSSVRDQLARRLSQVRHRSWLYRRVAYWYLLPCAAGIVLFRYGIGGQFRAGNEVLYGGIGVALFAGLYLINRWIGRTRYDSEVERLESLLADMDGAAPPAAE